MNTQLAFAFGMLAMVAIIMLVAIVVGIVKVIRHDRQFRNHFNDVSDCHRHISETERQLYQEINQLRTSWDRYSEEFRKELLGYVDSRVDKLEQKLTGTTGTKQLLKN